MTKSPVTTVTPHLAEALKQLKTDTITNPAVKARLLAAQLLEIAAVLERQMKEANKELSPEVAARVINSVAEPVHEAWRALYGLTKDRHQRLELIGCVSWGSDILQELGRTKPQGKADDGRLQAVTELTRDRYVITFPELTNKMTDLTKLEAAIIAWPQSKGRPTADITPKWKAIYDLFMTIGLSSAKPPSIRREWEKYSGEVLTGNRRFSKPPI